MEKNYSLQEFNTFGFDVKAKYFQEVKSLNDIRNLINVPEFIQHRDASHRILILSGGSNILFSNEMFDGFVVYPNLKGIELLEENDEKEIIRCYGGESWTDFVDYTVERNLYGLENLAGIPGKVGAAPVQNIGAYGAEVKNSVCQVHTIDLRNGEIRIFNNEECKFSYRNSIFKQEVSHFLLIYAVDFNLRKNGELKLDYGNIRNYLINNNITNPTIKDVAAAVKAIRAEKLPEVGVVGSAGSFFQNAIVPIDKYLKIKELYPDVPSFRVERREIGKYPLKDAISTETKRDREISHKYDEHYVKIPTGWLIEKTGWKGYRENGVGVWDKQALVLVNYGDSTQLGIIELMHKIQVSVKERFGIDIKPEVNIV